jgi:hypothetical protein
VHPQDSVKIPEQSVRTPLLLLAVRTPLLLLAVRTPLLLLAVRTPISVLVLVLVATMTKSWKANRLCLEPRVDLIQCAVLFSF